jgi:predicted ATP-binding protein involved in virulence
MAEPPSNQGVYFLSLTVENVLCFAEKQTLDLSGGNGRPAQWTVILGDNGTGKSTILDIAHHIFRAGFFVQNSLARSKINDKRRSYLALINQLIAVIKLANKQLENTELQLVADQAKQKIAEAILSTAEYSAMISSRLTELH